MAEVTDYLCNISSDELIENPSPHKSVDSEETLSIGSQTIIINLEDTLSINSEETLTAHSQLSSPKIYCSLFYLKLTVELFLILLLFIIFNFPAFTIPFH